MGAVRHLLPARVYAHLSDGVLEGLDGAFGAEPHGAHDKMALTDPERLLAIDTSGVERLTARDLDALLAFYAQSYPGNWFDPRMLETGECFGVRRDGALLSVAGVHVLSTTYGVAALGNIATRPDLRGQGLGTRVTAALCRSLAGRGVLRIGLNVEAQNAGAIACYQRLGFTKVGAYQEVLLTFRVPQN